MAKKNEGMGKFGDAMGGAAGGAAKGAQYGSMLGPVGTAAGAVIGGVAGGIKGGKLSPAEQAAKAAREQRERLQRDPNKVAGMSDTTQAKNVAAMTQALNPNDYAAGDSQAIQQAAQQAGTAAIGTQAQLAAQAAQAQQQQVLKLADYEAKMLSADEAQRKVGGKERQANMAADADMVAKGGASMDDFKESDFAKNAVAGAKNVIGKIGGLFGGAV